MYEKKKKEEDKMRNEDEGIWNLVLLALLIVVIAILISVSLVLAQTNETAAEEIEVAHGGICLPGFYGFDCAIVWLVAIILFFIAAMFRKMVAGELLNMPFSLIGSALVGEVVYIISLLVLHKIKWGLLLGLVGLIAGGFLLQFFGDTESSDE